MRKDEDHNARGEHCHVTLCSGPGRQTYRSDSDWCRFTHHVLGLSSSKVAYRTVVIIKPCYLIGITYTSHGRPCIGDVHETASKVPNSLIFGDIIHLPLRFACSGSGQVPPFNPLTPANHSMLLISRGVTIEDSDEGTGKICIYADYYVYYYYY